MQDEKMVAMLSKPRKFNGEERNILAKMLSAAISDKEIIMEQIENAKVTGYCKCGCKSVLISVEHKAPKYMHNVRVPVEMLTNDENDVPIQFLIHMINGYICELEILSVDSKAINGVLSLENVIINTYRYSN